jgi:diguanylate cyclase (GGDEF)-like protein
MDSQYPTILLIDDDPLSLEIAVAALRHMEPSWNIVGFEEPHSALEAAWELHQCVVVTDWTMPSMDGIELARRLRLREEDGHVYHVVLVTARTSIEDMEKGFEFSNDFVVKPYDPRELRARIRAGIRLLGRQSQLLADNANLTAQAETDPLTGLRNRRSALELALKEFDRYRRRRHPVSALMIDIDHFKSVNDNHGHATGDAILQEVAKALTSGLRPYDTLARWGGEEFLVLSPHCSFSDALGLAERLRKILSQSPLQLPEGGSLPVTASFGVASASIVADTLDAVAKSADRALYLAKKRGRNLVAGAIDVPESQTFVTSGAPLEPPG